MSETTGSASRAAKRAGRIRPRLVAAAVIIVLVVAFVIDNSEHVRMGFVFFHANVSLVWVLLVTAVLGASADRLLQHHTRVVARRGARERRQQGRGG